MSAAARKFIRGIDPRVSPGQLAVDFYREGNDSDFAYMLDFFEVFVAYMANLEDTQGGYRSLIEISQSDWCKDLYAAVLEIREDKGYNAIHTE